MVGIGSFNPLEGLTRWLNGQKKRAHERELRRMTVYLFDDKRLLGRANMMDESLGGAKLVCADETTPTLARYLLNPNTGVAHKIELAWREGRAAGVRYTGELRMRGYATDAGVDALRELWRRQAHLHQQGTDWG